MGPLSVFSRRGDRASSTLKRSRWTLLRFALLVALGATLGTFLRASLQLAYPHSAHGWPWVTFLINLSGSFILGLLLESLMLAGADEGWRRAVRLACGTGILGGFTTYSTFVLEFEKLALAGAPLFGVGYAFVSLILGVLAAGAGVVAATALSGCFSLTGKLVVIGEETGE